MICSESYILSHFQAGHAWVSSLLRWMVKAVVELKKPITGDAT